LKIFFHKESVSFPLDTSAINNWIENAVFSLDYSLKNLSFVFCDDEYLKNINVKYLGHDYYTDVITFDYSTEEGLVGDVFISIERVKENANNFKVSFNEELFRVIIHGVLHLCGFDDKTDKEIKEIRKQENYFLSLIG
jgi:rRNA maturation RNase YbeY